MKTDETIWISATLNSERTKPFENIFESIVFNSRREPSVFWANDFETNETPVNRRASTKVYFNDRRQTLRESQELFAIETPCVVRLSFDRRSERIDRISLDIAKSREKFTENYRKARFINEIESCKR